MTDVSLGLSEDAVEAIAQRVVELLSSDHAAPSGEGGRLVEAATVARKYAVSPAWVYDHADELGAIRLGTGAKPRLRFDLETVSKAMPSCSAGRGSPGLPNPDNKRISKPTPRDAMGTNTELLPVKGRQSPRRTPTHQPPKKEQ